MDDVRSEIARIHGHLRLRAIAGIGALTVIVFVMGGADAVARTAVALATDGWLVETKDASGAQTRRLSVSADVGTAAIKVENANIELAQQSSLPTSSAAGALAFDTADSAFKVYNGTSWVIPAIPPTRTVVTKPSDENYYSTTLHDDADLKFAIGANETWMADFWIEATHAKNGASGPHIQYAIQAPSGVSSLAYWVVAAPYSASPDNYLGLRMATSAGTAFGCTLSGTNQLHGHRVHIAITNGANSGFVTMQWAQVLSKSSAATVKAGSRLIATKIN